MSKAKGLVAVVLVASSLAACAQPGTTQPGEWGANKTTGGTLLGAAAGGLVGSQFGHGSGKLAATGAGVLLGGFLGHQAGASLDRADLAYHQQAQQQATTAPIGQQINWNNPQNGSYGTVTPVRDGRDQSGAYCREFQQTIVVGGQPQQAFGTACRQPDGSWRMVGQ